MGNPPPVINKKSKNSSETDAAMRILLPVNRSGYSIAAGYLGLISILLTPAPFALLFGFLGMRDIKNNDDKHGMGRAIFGIAMGAIFSLLLLWAIIRSTS